MDKEVNSTEWSIQKQSNTHGELILDENARQVNGERKSLLNT